MLCYPLLGGAEKATILRLARVYQLGYRDALGYVRWQLKLLGSVLMSRSVCDVQLPTTCPCEALTPLPYCGLNACPSKPVNCVKRVMYTNVRISHAAGEEFAPRTDERTQLRRRTHASDTIWTSVQAATAFHLPSLPPSLASLMIVSLGHKHIMRVPPPSDRGPGSYPWRKLSNMAPTRPGTRAHLPIQQIAHSPVLDEWIRRRTAITLLGTQRSEPERRRGLVRSGYTFPHPSYKELRVPKPPKCRTRGLPSIDAKFGIRIGLGRAILLRQFPLYAS